MRKLVFSTNITLDGFIDHTAGVADEELHEKSSELLRSGDLILFGRKAYQLMAEYWPSALADETITPSEREFANTINPMEKIVFSKTLQDVSWNTRILRGVDPSEIQALKRMPGNNLLLGPGAQIAQAFMELDLIDEYRLWIHPVILGKGIPLFRQQDQRKDLTLIGQNSFRSGVMELIYRPKRLIDNPLE